MAEPGIVELGDVPDAIRRLQRSSRQAVPLTVVGLIATLAAAAVALYYIFSLSQRLDQANAQLRQAQEQVNLTRQQLGTLSRTLADLQKAPPAARDAQIEVALADVQATRRTLGSASASIEQASQTLPTEPPQTGGRFFTVLASYGGNEDGLARGRQHLARLQSSGICATIWKAAISGHYAVVLGGPSDRDGALDNVARAKAQGLAGDAFAQRDSGWSLMARSAPCRDEAERAFDAPEQAQASE